MNGFVCCTCAVFSGSLSGCCFGVGVASRLVGSWASARVLPGVFVFSLRGRAVVGMVGALRASALALEVCCAFGIGIGIGSVSCWVIHTCFIHTYIL